MRKTGSRLQVFRGKATQTSGGLKKSQLAKNKKGKIVSKKKQSQAKAKSNLKKYLVSRDVKHKPVKKKEVLLDLTVDTPVKRKKKKDPLAAYREQQKRKKANDEARAQGIGARRKNLRKLRAEQKKLRAKPKSAT